MAKHQYIQKSFDTSKLLFCGLLEKNWQPKIVCLMVLVGGGGGGWEKEQKEKEGETAPPNPPTPLGRRGKEEIEMKGKRTKWAGLTAMVVAGRKNIVTAAIPFMTSLWERITRESCCVTMLKLYPPEQQSLVI